LSWQRVDAVVKAGGWPTRFHADLGRFGADTPTHVSTPDAETVVDALHPSGFQLSGGSRIHDAHVRGRVKQGIDTSWHSHAVIPKTVIDLLGLAPFGISRVDTSASLRDGWMLRWRVQFRLLSAARSCSRRRPIQDPRYKRRTVGRAECAAIAGFDGQWRREDSGPE